MNAAKEIYKIYKMQYDDIVKSMQYYDKLRLTDKKAAERWEKLRAERKAIFKEMQYWEYEFLKVEKLPKG